MATKKTKPAPRLAVTSYARYAEIEIDGVKARVRRLTKDEALAALLADAVCTLCPCVDIDAAVCKSLDELVAAIDAAGLLDDRYPESELAMLAAWEPGRAAKMLRELAADNPEGRVRLV